MDIVDSSTRSEMMSRILSWDTKLGLMIRTLLHKLGFRFRLDVKELLGKPNIVFPKYEAIVFVHCCFWHGDDCGFFKWLTTHTSYWRNKISRSRARDSHISELLRKDGWRVAVNSECAIRHAQTAPFSLVCTISKCG